MGTNDATPLRRVVGSPQAIRAHLLARTALLDTLSHDPGVTAAFSECGEVNDLAFRMGELGEHLARRAGLPGRAALFTGDKTVPAEYQALNARYTRLVADAINGLSQRLMTLVYETWQLEWPWLVLDLLEHYQRLLNSIITGEGWAGAFGEAPRPAPALLPGETVETYLRRIRPALPSERASASTRRGSGATCACSIG
jgi:hypothetical protein